MKNTHLILTVLILAAYERGDAIVIRRVGVE